MKTSDNDTWLTPPEIILGLGPFDLDPCTPDYMPWSTAERRFTLADNGLIQPWEGRVWLNPPYSNVVPWVKKMGDHRNGIALLFCRTGSRWFSDHIFKKAHAIHFYRGRIFFYDNAGQQSKYGGGVDSVFVSYSAYDTNKIVQSKILGKTIIL